MRLGFLAEREVELRQSEPDHCSMLTAPRLGLSVTGSLPLSLGCVSRHRAWQRCKYLSSGYGRDAGKDQS